MESEEDKKVKVEKKVKAEQEHNNNSEIDLVEFSRKLSMTTASSDADEDDDVVVLGTSGPVHAMKDYPEKLHSSYQINTVALRDFPHPRSLCANFPFGSTPHEKYCSQCYCVICDVVAPCSNWEGSDAHCNIISKKRKEKNEITTSPERKLF